MTPTELKKMTVEQLVTLFEAIALEQDKALLHDEIKKYNRLYREMDALKEELKGRAGDQRRALVPLLQHSNGLVSLKAAIATLALAPEDARRTLQMLSDAQDYPATTYARGMLRALAEGTYTPS